MPPLVEVEAGVAVLAEVLGEVVAGVAVAVAAAAARPSPEWHRVRRFSAGHPCIGEDLWLPVMFAERGMSGRGPRTLSGSSSGFVAYFNLR